jgi:hypothetical protein
MSSQELKKVTTPGRTSAATGASGHEDSGQDARTGLSKRLLGHSLLHTDRRLAVERFLRRGLEPFPVA